MADKQYIEKPKLTYWPPQDCDQRFCRMWRVHHVREEHLNGPLEQGPQYVWINNCPDLVPQKPKPPLGHGSGHVQTSQNEEQRHVKCIDRVFRRREQPSRGQRMSNRETYKDMPIDNQYDANSSRNIDPADPRCQRHLSLHWLFWRCVLHFYRKITSSVIVAKCLTSAGHGMIENALEGRLPKEGIVSLHPIRSAIMLDSKCITVHLEMLSISSQAVRATGSGQKESLKR